MTIQEIIHNLKAKLAACPIKGRVYKMFRARTKDKPLGGFDISADDEYGTYRVAEFSEGGNKSDGTYWSNAERNREAFIALWQSAPALLQHIEEQAKELQQFRDVAGLSPIEYPFGRRCPDAELMQDPAYLAFKLNKLENEHS